MRRAFVFARRLKMDIDNITKTTVLAAYRVLFAWDAEVTGKVIRSVELPEIKKAYRRKALDTHPDRLASGDENLQKAFTERFIEVSLSFRSCRTPQHHVRSERQW
jgi:hypothetical protein